jgi:hypothetical protein
MFALDEVESMPADTDAELVEARMLRRTSVVVEVVNADVGGAGEVCIGRFTRLLPITRTAGMRYVDMDEWLIGGTQGRTGGHLSLFLNTKDTEFTEYHPAHFEKRVTVAATDDTNLRPHRPAAPPLGEVGRGSPSREPSPSPPGGLGGAPSSQPSPSPTGEGREGLHRATTPSPPGRLGWGSLSPPTGEGWGGALSPTGEGWGGLSPAPWGRLGRAPPALGRLGRGLFSRPLGRPGRGLRGLGGLPLRLCWYQARLLYAVLDLYWCVQPREWTGDSLSCGRAIGLVGPIMSPRSDHLCTRPARP